MNNLTVKAQDVLAVPCPCTPVAVNNTVHGFGIIDGTIYATHKQVVGPELPPGSTIILASYISSTDVLVLILSSGEILKLEGYTANEQDMEYETVGILTDGIECAAVDSSEQFLSVVSKAKRLIFFSIMSNFDIINDVKIDSSDRGAEELITVGWGKKETQFHGTAGKSAALKKEIVIERLHEEDDMKSRICWRNDQYVAVSIVDETRGAISRKIRVFDNTGRHLSTGEPVSRLEGSLAWCSDRNIIASTQLVPSQNKRQVIFFERNGLRHLEFDLNRTCHVVELLWSPSGNYLFVQYSDSVCQLWTMLNYHWYCKSEWTVQGIIQAIFVNDHLLAVSTGDNLVFYSIKSSFSHHDACVAVVDGKSVGFTPFDLAVYPPPMSYLQHQISFVPNIVILGEKFCLLQSSDFDYELISFEAEYKSCSVVKSGKLAHRAALLVGDDIYCLTDGDELIDEIGETKIFEGIVNVKRSEILNNHYLSINAIENSVNIHDQSFAVIDVILNNNIPHVYDVIKVGQKHHLVCINGSKLLLDDSQIFNNVISCLFTSDFTFVTLSTQKMYTLPNEHVSKWTEIVKTESEESSHFVEAGAELLCCDRKEGKLTLILPRGNLECIYPRAILLKSLRSLIDRLDYSTAYSQCRRHRIDLNILHDHNPQVFMANVKRFIGQVKNASWLNLFVMGLEEENVAVTKYGGFVKENLTGTKKLKGKIESVCNAILNTLHSLDNNKEYIETIITAHVKLNQVEESLQVLKSIATASGNRDDRFIEKTIKYLIFLVPAEQLYETALGMYDLSLALTFAKKSSQMDPKEYMSLLETLARLAESERRFKIDDHLKRHEKAIVSLYELVKSGERLFEEFLDYVVKNKQYLPAVKACFGKEEHERKVLSLFGDHLQERRCVKDAGIVYALTRNQSYCQFLAKNNLWAELLIIDPLFTPQSEFLKGRPEEFIHYQYLKNAIVNPELALSRAIAERQYLDICILSKSQHKFSPQDYMTALQKIGEELDSFIERWEPLQLKFAQDPIAALTPTSLKSTGDGSDNTSELSFAGSILSRTTSNASSKKSKKHQDKHRLRDKPGSPHERLFLQNAVNERIESLSVLIQEAKPLIQALLLSRQFEEAALLQRQLLAKIKIVDDFKTKLEAMLAKQKEKECMDIMVLRLLLEDAYTINIKIPNSWNDRSWMSFIFS